MARILIVDDSLVMRKNLKIILQEAGHTVVGEAIDGQQAYLEYRKAKPDLVTMDITMPKVDGIDALKNIMDNFPKANVIMISALDQKSKVFSALRNGAKHYIIKPVTAEKIITVIDKVLIDATEKDRIIREEQEAGMSQPPFAIENKDGAFVVTLAQDMELSDVMVLDTAMKGFLLLKPLNILFEFDAFEIKGEEALTKFDALLHKIKAADGKMKIKSRNRVLIEKLTDKDSGLVIEQSNGWFVVE